MSFKDRLKKARLEKGLKQTELSLKIGLSKNVVSNYEAGTSFPNTETLYKIFDVLEVEPNFLFWDELSNTLKSKILDQNNLNKYENLNSTGQQKVNDYINDLLVNPNYTKNDIINKDIVQEISNTLKQVTQK